MPKVNNFVYCLGINQAINGNEQILNANGIITALIPEFIPTSFSFSLLFSIVDLDEDRQKTLKITVTDPKGNEIINTGEISCPAEPMDEIQKYLPNDARGIHFGMDFKNVILEHEGYYITNVFYGNEKIGENKIYAIGKRNHVSSS